MLVNFSQILEEPLNITQPYRGEVIFYLKHLSIFIKIKNTISFGLV